MLGTVANRPVSKPVGYATHAGWTVCEGHPGLVREWRQDGTDVYPILVSDPGVGALDCHLCGSRLT